MLISLSRKIDIKVKSLNPEIKKEEIDFSLLGLSLILMLIGGILIAPIFVQAAPGNGNNNLGTIKNSATNLTSELINVYFPIIAIIGLLIGGALWIIGSQDAKERTGQIIFGISLGLLAPKIYLTLKKNFGSSDIEDVINLDNNSDSY